MADIVHADSTNAMDRDIGLFAAWSVSSSKPGFEVEQLTDPSTSTFWQSEGPQPHHINITFPRRMAIAQLSIFVDIGLDDSYTPQKLSIRAGTFQGDLQEVKYVELDNPRGWVHFPLGSLAESDGSNADELDYTDPEAHGIKANILQLAILGNHLNGKDTHVRHVRVFAPKRREPVLDEEELSSAGIGEWKTEIMKMHQTVPDGDNGLVVGSGWLSTIAIKTGISFTNANICVGVSFINPAIAAKKSPSLFAQLLLYEVDKGRRAATALPRHAVAALSYGDTPLYIQGSEEMRLA